MHVEIVSQAGQLWEGQAESVVVPTVSGEIGILARHTPVLALLAPGETRVVTADGSQATFTTGEGFVTVDHDEVIVVVEDAALREGHLPTSAGGADSPADREVSA